MTPSDPIQPRPQCQLLLRKAAQDKAVLDKLMDDPAIEDETLGYHAQQAAEKLLKALLAHSGHAFPAATTSACCLICLRAMVFCYQSDSRTWTPSLPSAPFSATTISPSKTIRVAKAGRP